MFFLLGALLSFGSLFLGPPPVWAAVPTADHGDAGSDLEGAVPIVSGKITEARQKALELLKRLNTTGVSGLGLLIPEVERSPLYMADRNMEAVLREDQGSFHSSMQGLVFSRTIYEPHAATRFFPIAEKLGDEQLMALHIHQALHRALPPSVREDETIVSSLTLSITAPEATHQHVVFAVSKLVPELSSLSLSASGSGQVSSQSPAVPPVAPKPSSASLAEPTLTLAQAEERVEVPADAPMMQPSTLGYSYRAFRKPKAMSAFPVERMHVIQSFVYPFGSARVPVGIGIEAGFIGRESITQTGPFGLSVRGRLWTQRGLDLWAWGNASLNAFSNPELKHSPLGRDVFSLGLSLRKDFKLAYLESRVGYSFDGSSNQTIALSEYTYRYGGIVQASTHAGMKWGKLRVGGFAELSLAEYFRVENEEFPFDSGRYRIISGGPEISWQESNLALIFSGRYLLDATQFANFDYLGDLLRQGAAYGSLNGSLQFYF